ncbi:MAG: hypothetical protein ABIO51_07675 [Solirubrobacteraceae bacterium]
MVLPARGELALVDPDRGVVARIGVGASPWGVAVAGGRLLTVGAEALEGGSRPNLSILDLSTGRERLVELTRPHEDIAVDRAERTAYLSGGYTRGGWRGVTAVELASGRSREIALDDAPLGVAVLPGA